MLKNGLVGDNFACVSLNTPHPPLLLTHPSSSPPLLYLLLTHPLLLITPLPFYFVFLVNETLLNSEIMAIVRGFTLTQHALYFTRTYFGTLHRKQPVFVHVWHLVCHLLFSSVCVARASQALHAAGA